MKNVGDFILLLVVYICKLINNEWASPCINVICIKCTKVYRGIKYARFLAEYIQIFQKAVTLDMIFRFNMSGCLSNCAFYISICLVSVSQEVLHGK